MKRYINAMALNTVQKFTACAPAWVAYECFRRANEDGRVIKVSDNRPGKLVTLEGIHKYPSNTVIFQITPIDEYNVIVKVDFDGSDFEGLVEDAVKMILNF